MRKGLGLFDVYLLASAGLLQRPFLDFGQKFKIIYLFPIKINIIGTCANGILQSLLLF